ncbi:MAG TPA: hypothetical protein PK758_15150, partial [Tenuifilaceae bacterium]|nr:hypothetical protein [Tenuifilaceae bacterium]
MPADGQKYTFELNTPKAEPTNQCTNLTASVAADNLSVTWTDAEGTVTPDGYLLMVSKTNSFTDPVDGISVANDLNLSDGVGITKVLQGLQSFYGWSGLESSTNYYFKVFSYTNSSGLINYKTVSAPTAQVYMLKSQPQKHVTSFSAKNVANVLTFEWNDILKFGNSLRSDGENTCNIDCGNSSSLNISGNAITLEAWVNMNQVYADIFQKENSTLDGGYRMYGNSLGQLCFGLYINGSWSEVKSPVNSLTALTWTHICG